MSKKIEATDTRKRYTHDDFVQETTEELIELLENNNAPWQQEWDAGKVGPLHHNTISGNEYRGVNQLKLDLKAMKKGYHDVRWLTYQQAKELGGQVRKKEKGTKIAYWDWYYRKGEKDIYGNIVEKENQKKRPSPRVYFSSVFNGAQIDGLEPVKENILSIPNFDLDRRGEKIIQDSGIAIHENGNKAFYSPTLDVIKTPHKGAFLGADDYYSTILHELSHATGHEKRLAREFAYIKGSQTYAKEELRAEIGSYMVAKISGLPHEPKHKVAYVQHWIKVLKDDPKEIYRACGDADKIKDWLLYPEKRQELEKVAQAKAEKEREKKVTSRKPRTPEVVMQEKPKLTPEQSLHDAMQEMGLRPKDNIVMDGRWHRVQAEGDAQGKLSGSYKAYGDGLPNGVMTNHKTGETLKWLYRENKLSPDEITTLRHEAKHRKEQQEKELQETQKQAAKNAYGLWQNGTPTKKHPYLIKKGIDDHGGVARVHQKTNALMIPLYNAKGTLQSLQFIYEEPDGSFKKSFLKDGRIKDSMCKIQGEDTNPLPTNVGLIAFKNKNSPTGITVIAETRRIDNGNSEDEKRQNYKNKPIVIAEGYATAKSIHDATGLTSVVAFSAHQLENIATITKKLNPQQPIIIAGDSDAVGKEKATAAAKALDVSFILPQFRNDEKKQGLSDFNDLAVSRGIGEVRKQFNRILDTKKEREMII